MTKTDKKATSKVRPAPVSLAAKVRTANRWRDSLNPMRGLTMTRAAALLEAYPRGEFADVMWTYGAPMTGIESADADLIALIERRTGAVLEMDYTIKQVDKETLGFDQALADDQLAALTEAYDGIGNLYDAIEHLCMATFRGFAQVEKWRSGDGDIHHLEIVDQWNVVRDGLANRWKYNPDARSTGYRGLSDELIMAPENFVWREVRRPVNRIALLKMIRQNLSQKDWDAFIEIYGIPGGVITLPPNVSDDRAAEYEASAKAVAEGGSGALPHGSTYTANDGPRGTNPFRDHLEYLTQKLVLAGTGGLLTMLAESGSGTLAGSAHMEAFETLARSEARKISQCFQRAIDAEILDNHFPGQDPLAYFELAANEETDTSKFITDVGVLAQAGFQVDPAQIEEKTGYKVTIKPVAPAPFGMPSAGPLQNKAPSAALNKALAPTQEEIAAMLANADLTATAQTLETLLLAAAQKQ